MLYTVATLAELEQMGRATRTLKWPGRYVAFAAPQYSGLVEHPRAGTGWSRGYYAQDAHVWDIADAVVHADSGLVTVGELAIAESLIEAYHGLERVDANFIKAPSGEGAKASLPKAVHAVCDGAYNLYHLLFGSIARTGLIDAKDRTPVLIPKLTTPVQRDLYAFTGIRSSELKVSTRVQHLVFPDHVGAFGNFDIHPYARRLFKRMQQDQGIVTAPHSNVFIGRRDAVRRRMTNEPALWAALASSGFACFDFSMKHLSARDQMQICTGAQRIVAPHGAGLMWLAFCEPSTAVLELFPTTYINWCYRSVAEVGRLTYRASVSRDATNPSSPHDITWNVDVDHIMQRVEALVPDHYAHTIQGYFNFEDLYEELVATAPLGARIVEVGSWKGTSIAFLGMEAKRTGRTDLALFAVDTWKGTLNEQTLVDDVKFHGGSIRHVFDETLRRGGLERLVTAIEGDSAASAARFADGSLHAVFIDADHSYEGCLRDIKAWTPKVRSGGIVSGHDAPHPPVLRAVREVFGDAAELRGSCWVVRR